MHSQHFPTEFRLAYILADLFICSLPKGLLYLATHFRNMFSLAKTFVFSLAKFALLFQSRSAPIHTCVI